MRFIGQPSRFSVQAISHLTKMGRKSPNRAFLGKNPTAGNPPLRLGYAHWRQAIAFIVLPDSIFLLNQSVRVE